MVSNFRYFSPKMLTLRGRVPFVALVAVVLGFAIVLADPPRVLLTLSVLYALSGPVQWLVRSIERQIGRAAMTNTLADEHCVRVTRSSKRVPESERDALLLQVPEWSVATRDGIERLERVFKFAELRRRARVHESHRSAGRGRRSSPRDPHRMGSCDYRLVDARSRRLAPERLRDGGADRPRSARGVLIVAVQRGASNRRAVPLRHSVRELLETRDRIFPTDARVRDALSVRRARARCRCPVVLRSRLLSIITPMMRGSAAFELTADVGADVELLPKLLAAVRVTHVHHQPRRQSRGLECLRCALQPTSAS